MQQGETSEANLGPACGARGISKGRRPRVYPLVMNVRACVVAGWGLSSCAACVAISRGVTTRSGTQAGTFTLQS